MAADLVLDGLLKACDGRARAAEDRDAVAGVPARYVAAPASTGEASEVLALAAQHELRVVARGSGSKLGWGAPPTGVDLVVDTTALAGVVDHAAGDLVVVARAGTPVLGLQAHLATAGQQLALDTPVGGTVGGAVATAASGPRRLLYGTVRDLLIGVTFVRADGVVAKAGGRVVKNVAGYDFGKLLAGSYGTLGLVTEAAFRLHPLPQARRVVTVEVVDGAAAGRVAAAVLGSQLVPTALEVDQPADGAASVAVLLEGIEAGATGRAGAAVSLLGAGAATTDVTPPWFGAYPFGADETGLKLTSTITGVGPLLDAARRAGDAQGVPLHVRGSAMGALYAGLPAGTAPSAAAAVVDALRADASSYGGTVTVLSAPPPVRDAVDVWGPVPGLELMRRVKRELDPGHRLAPGRFVGGI
jgi:glycolate dehydrogenase FAD-binding subunit